VELLAIPGLIWIALRFGRRRVLLALGVLTAALALMTARGLGPFASTTPLQSILRLAIYVSAMAIVSLVVASLAADRARAEARLADLSESDALTGLGNYRRLLAVLRAEIARSDRSKRPFAILVVDVDGLKRINDEAGYRTGSRALVRVAGAIRHSCRITDAAARFGGDEFAIVLTETDRTGAERLLRRINENLAAGDEKPAVVVQGGIAAYPDDGGTPGKLLRVAAELLKPGQRYGEEDELPSAGPSGVDVAPLRQGMLVATPASSDGHRRDIVDDADVAVG
jgi:diguanylate cyclase (GGDEF)-like protein